MTARSATVFFADGRDEAGLGAEGLAEDVFRPVFPVPVLVDALCAASVFAAFSDAFCAASSAAAFAAVSS